MAETYEKIEKERNKLRSENAQLREALLALDQSINKYGECEANDTVYKMVSEALKKGE